MESLQSLQPVYQAPNIVRPPSMSTVRLYLSSR